jgi:hypothetical protein
MYLRMYVLMYARMYIYLIYSNPALIHARARARTHTHTEWDCKQEGACPEVSTPPPTPPPPAPPDVTTIVNAGVCPLWKQLFDRYYSRDSTPTDAEVAPACNELAENDYDNACANLVKVNKDCHQWPSACTRMNPALPSRFSCKYPTPPGPAEESAGEDPKPPTHEVSTGVFRHALLMCC